MCHTSTTEPLPQEIIDEILDHCWRAGQTSSLAACSVVCRSFGRRCQQYFFSAIVFKSNDSQNKNHPDRMTRRVATFLEILKISPWIAGYVQELHLWVSNTEGEAYGEDIGFLRVMSLLTEARTGSGLQRLTLRGAYYGLAFKDSLALVKNLLRPYISPFITSLCITRLKNIPIAFVAECTHLESLSLHDLQSTMDEDLSLSHPPNARPPSIKTLEVINSDQFLKALLAGQASACAPCIDSSQLRRITSKPASRSDFQESIQAIINEAGNSLEEMEFTPKHGHCNELVYVPLHNLFDFSNSAGLKNLTIDVKVGSPEEVDPIAGLVTILKTIPTDNRVARMKFRLYLGFNTVYHPDRCLELNWRSLDLEIARISSGRPLRLQLEVWYQEFIREEQTEDEDGEAPAEPSSDDENLGVPRAELEERCDVAFRKVVQEGLSLISGEPSVVIEVNRRIVEPCDYCRTCGVFPSP